MKPAAAVVLFASLLACGPKQTEDSADSGGATTTSTGPGGTDSSTLIIVTGEPTETGGASPACPDPNSALSNGQCYCKAFYDWCSPDDPNDLSCCPSPGTTGAATSASDPSGDPATSAPATSEPSTGDATTGEPACGAPPPAQCDPDDQARLCDSGPDCALADSTLYRCVDGVWQPADADAMCVAEGHDFAFGCVRTGDAAQLQCGDGPGTACNPDDMAFCQDLTVLQSCIHGKLADTDCVAACKAGEVDGVQHVGGYCEQSRVSSHCACCDQPNCP